jgi:hypothetical protein
MAQGRKEMTPKDVKRANNRDRMLQRSLRSFEDDETEIVRLMERFERINGREPVDTERLKIRTDHVMRCRTIADDLARRIATRGLQKTDRKPELFDDDDEVLAVEAK